MIFTKSRVKKIKNVEEKNDSSLEELIKIVDNTNISKNLKNTKSILYKAVVKNFVKNLDYIIISSLIFYLTKSVYSEND